LYLDKIKVQITLYNTHNHMKNINQMESGGFEKWVNSLKKIAAIFALFLTLNGTASAQGIDQDPTVETSMTKDTPQWVSSEVQVSLSKAEQKILDKKNKLTRQIKEELDLLTKLDSSVVRTTVTDSITMKTVEQDLTFIETSMAGSPNFNRLMNLLKKWEFQKEELTDMPELLSVLEHIADNISKFSKDGKIDEGVVQLLKIYYSDIDDICLQNNQDFFEKYGNRLFNATENWRSYEKLVDRKKLTAVYNSLDPNDPGQAFYRESLVRFFIFLLKWDILWDYEARWDMYPGDFKLLPEHKEEFKKIIEEFMAS